MATLPGQTTSPRLAADVYSPTETSAAFCSSLGRTKEFCRSGRLRILKQLFDVGGDGIGLGGGGKAIDDVAAAIDKEFGEIPLDALAAE